MELAIGVGIFLVIVLLFEGIYYASQSGAKPEKRRVRRRLRTLSAGGYEKETISILRKTTLSDIPWFHRLLMATPLTLRINRLLEMANAQRPLAVYLLFSLLLAALGFILGMYRSPLLYMRILLALFGALLPFFYLVWLKKKRMAKFERQLPDALDLIARSLKAGHAFSSGLKMTADEFDDPIGTEFGKTLDEINFGVGVDDALKSMAERVDCPDLKFFVVSVIIQRETGGNLAEIMESLALLIRERFKLLGKVRILAAEGKLSAYILLALPFFMAGYFILVKPEYMKLLLEDPIGHRMIIVALIMMTVGTIVMRKMIQIRI